MSEDNGDGKRDTDRSTEGPDGERITQPPAELSLEDRIADLAAHLEQAQELSVMARGAAQRCADLCAELLAELRVYKRGDDRRHAEHGARLTYLEQLAGVVPSEPAPVG